MIGEMAEPGVYKEGPPQTKPTSREKLFKTAKRRRFPNKQSSEPRKSALRDEILAQTEKRWVSGPHSINENGGLFIGDEKLVVNPAYTFGVQQAEKLRAVDDLERSSTNEAATVRSPINLPS